jgi:hypothetical protein
MIFSMGSVGGTGNTCRTLAWNTKGKRPLGWLRLKRQNNIKRILKTG